MTTGEAPGFSNGNAKRQIHFFSGFLLDLLLDHGADINARDHRGWPPIFYTREVGTAEVLQVFIDRGADVHATGEHGRTILHAVAGIPRAMSPPDSTDPYCEFLVEQGLDPSAADDRGVQPVHLAANWANLPLIRFLVEHGARLHALDGEERNVLHWVAARPRFVFASCPCITYLCDAGLQLEARDTGGYTPLHVAAQWGTPESLQCLLDLRSRVDAVGEDGRTPLHLASERGALEIVNLLLKAGADVSAENSAGETPLHLAEGAGHQEVAARLRAASDR